MNPHRAVRNISRQLRSDDSLQISLTSNFSIARVTDANGGEWHEVTARTVMACLPREQNFLVVPVNERVDVNL